MAEQRLRVALVLEGSSVPAWQYLLLERILALHHVQLALVLRLPAPLAPWQERLLAVGLNALHAVDANVHRHQWQANRPCPVAGLLAGVRVLALDAPEAAAQFADGLIHAVIDLGTRAADLPPYVSLLPEYGCWRHVYGDGLESSAAAYHWAGAQEYADGRGASLSGVVAGSRWYAEPQCLLLSGSATHACLSESHDAMLWKMSAFVPALLGQLAKFPAGRDFFREKRLRYLPELPTQVRERFVPRFALLSRVGMRSVRNGLQRLRTKLTRTRQWVLLTGQADDPFQGLAGLVTAQRLVPPSSLFWADPCLVVEGGRQYVFFEEFVFGRGRGHLACMELLADGSHSPPVTVLQRPYHLSYPFLFSYQDQWYLIPESAENGTVDLYRCTDFPHQWVYVKTLMQGVEAYDATLYPHAGRWWMFVNLRHHPGCSPHELLYLFSAASPLDSEWEPHPCNPIVTQAASARPAGRLFMQDGNIYRPSQNCAGSYGRGLNLNQVIEWNSHSYKEKTISQNIPAGSGALEGLHTLSFVAGRVVGDGINVRNRWQKE